MAEPTTAKSRRRESIEIGRQCWKRFEPFCPNWGNGRGGAIDRYYIDRFIKEELRSARGTFLECGGDRYKPFIKRAHLRSYDVVDINERIPSLTIHRNIEDLQGIPRDCFNVVICTQVLQYVESPQKAMGELRRVLKPGGKLLLSTPFVEKDYARLGDRWRFTRNQIACLLSDFRSSRVSIRGNLFVTACYWMGLGMDDVSPRDLKKTDAVFYQVVLAKAIK